MAGSRPPSCSFDVDDVDEAEFLSSEDPRSSAPPEVVGGAPTRASSSCSFDVNEFEGTTPHSRRYERLTDLMTAQAAPQGEPPRGGRAKKPPGDRRATVDLVRVSKTDRLGWPEPEAPDSPMRVASPRQGATGDDPDTARPSPSDPRRQPRDHADLAYADADESEGRDFIAWHRGVPSPRRGR